MERETPLAARLNVFDLTCLGLNCVIGTGIFFTPGIIGRELGGYGPFAFLAGGILCLAIGLCFAEMAGMFPGNGGAFLYARGVFGAWAGFVVGWIMWLSTLLGGASVAVAFGIATAEAVGVPWLRHPASLGIVLLLAVVNYLGVRSGAVSNNLLAVAKLLPLAVFLGWAGASLELSQGFSLSPPAQMSFLAGFLPVLYTFSGFEYVPVPGGEVRNPQHTIPLALTFTLLGSSALYFLVQVVVGAAGGAGSETPLVTAAAAAPWLAALIGLGSLVSVASVNASIAFTSPRCLWVLAWGGWMPPWLAGLHPVYASPVTAILVSSTLTMILTIYATFKTLADLSVLASLLQYLPTILGVLVLRFRAPERDRPYRIPAGPVVALLALAVCVVLIVKTDPSYLRGLAIALAVGMVVALAGRGRRS
ncbi:MAG: APC family permease [Candidatus Eremiobacterota bacterium]